MTAFDRAPLEGILALNPLCVSADGTINHEEIASNVAWLADNGADGFVQFASMGQAHAPSEGEFDRVVETAVDAADDLACVVGCMAPSQREVVRRAATAERAGADGAMVALPYAFPVVEDWIGEFFRGVDEALSELAVMVYNYPPLTDVNVSAAVWRDTLLDVESVKAVKDSNFSFLHHNDVLLATRDHVNYVSPGDVFFWHDSALGAEGFIGILYWVAPTVFRAFYEACVDGRQLDPWVLEVYEKTSSALGTMMALPDTPLLPYEPAILNALVEIGGRHGGPPRDPYGPLSDEAYDALVDAVRPLVEMEREL